MTPRLPFALVLVAAIAAIAGGCANVNRVASSGPADAGFSIVQDELFRPGETVLAGFEPFEPTASHRGGDRVLMGISVDRGAEREVRFLEIFLVDGGPMGQPWQVTLTVPDRSEPEIITSPARMAMLVLHDDRAQFMSATAGNIPQLLMEYGLFDTAAIMYERQQAGEETPDEADPPDADERRRVTMGFVALSCMAQALSRNDILRELVIDTIERPSILGLMFGGGINIELRPDTQIGRTTTSLSAGGIVPAFRLPLHLVQGSKTLLDLDVLVVPLAPPMGLCGGVVAIDAWNPSRPDINIRIRLLATRRGGPGGRTNPAPGMGH